MGFWFRNGIFAVILSVLAYFLLANHELLMSINDEFTLEVESPEPKKEEAPQEKATVVEPPQASKKTLNRSKNKAAEGLSRFYANLHGTDEDDGPKIRNGVVFLPDPKGPLEDTLEAKAMVTRPLSKNWRSDVENRPFRAGNTLLQKMVEYAEKDGLEIMWRLNRDLLIKDPFRVNKDILQTAFQIGNAISGHFPEGVQTYFCYKQRTIVFNSGPSEYLSKECKLLTSKSSLSKGRSY